MLSEFVDKKMSEAVYKLLEDGSYFGEIPSIRGVWASAKKLEECRHQLHEVLEDWIVLSLRNGEVIPGFHIHSGRVRMPTYA